MITNKIRRRHVDYTWPGFVDALSSLLMVIIFVLMIFVLSQFFLSQKRNLYPGQVSIQNATVGYRIGVLNILWPY